MKRARVDDQTSREVDVNQTHCDKYVRGDGVYNTLKVRADSIIGKLNQYVQYDTVKTVDGMANGAQADNSHEQSVANVAGPSVTFSVQSGQGVHSRDRSGEPNPSMVSEESSVNVDTPSAAPSVQSDYDLDSDTIER